MAEPESCPATSRAFHEPVGSYSQEQRMTETPHASTTFTSDAWESFCGELFPLQNLYARDQNKYLVDADFLTVFDDRTGDSVDILARPPLLPQDIFLASPNLTPEGWNPCAAADQQFPQTPMEVIHGVQYLGPIATTATPVTMVVQDPSPRDAAPCMPNMYLAGPQTPLATDVATACFQVAQQPLAPSLSGPPLLRQQPQIAHLGSPMSQSIGCTQQLSPLCASKRANSSELPDWQLLKHEMKRAGRRAAEMRHRKKEREDYEKIETTSKRLQGLHTYLVAEERALKAEKLTLMGQLLTHPHCNDSNIAEYLSYAPKQIVKKAREQQFLSAQGQRARSAPV